MTIIHHYGKCDHDIKRGMNPLVLDTCPVVLFYHFCLHTNGFTGMIESVPRPTWSFLFTPFLDFLGKKCFPYYYYYCYLCYLYYHCHHYYNNITYNNSYKKKSRHGINMWGLVGLVLHSLVLLDSSMCKKINETKPQGMYTFMTVFMG